MSAWTSSDKTLGGTDMLLLEDAFYVLQETGDKIILEQSAAGTITWSSTTMSSDSWNDTLKVGIDDVVGIESTSDILGTEDGYNIGLDQSNSTGVTWSGTNKT